MVRLYYYSVVNKLDDADCIHADAVQKSLALSGQLLVEYLSFVDCCARAKVIDEFVDIGVFFTIVGVVNFLSFLVAADFSFREVARFGFISLLTRRIQ